jgi:hypothetical protein
MLLNNKEMLIGMTPDKIDRFVADARKAGADK